MSDVLALVGTIALFNVITTAILVCHAITHQRQVDRLEDIVRSIGMRVGSPPSELPPVRDTVDEYSPDAVIDDETVQREWQLPRRWL